MRQNSAHTLCVSPEQKPKNRTILFTVGQRAACVFALLPLFFARVFLLEEAKKTSASTITLPAASSEESWAPAWGE